MEITPGQRVAFYKRYWKEIDLCEERGYYVNGFIDGRQNLDYLIKACQPLMTKKDLNEDEKKIFVALVNINMEF